ncbi:MAG: GNAT family N-acetyltransferase [Cellulosilyticaceae bacterium]
MNIRQEQVEDYKKVYEVISTAFASAEHADGNEQDLVNSLREGKAFVPELSLVAEINEEVVGHIMFTKAKVDNNEVLALAPLSVLPSYQKQGVGTALIKEGHRVAKKLGYKCILVVGSEKYYPRMGYIPAETIGIEAPFEVPSQNFMVYCIDSSQKSIKGVIEYAEEFGI